MLASSSTQRPRQDALKAALQIDGWLTLNEAGLLYDLAKAAQGPIIEIGSWQGRSTAALALGSMAGNNQSVYAVDPFIGVHSNDRLTNKGNKPKPSDSSKEILRANLDNAGVNGLVTILPKTAQDAVNSVPDCAVLFVDGDHSYAAVSNDLQLYLPKVKVGGTVVLHDVDNCDPGVAQAIDEQIMTKPDSWRVRGRYSSAVAFERITKQQEHSVMLAYPGRPSQWGSVLGIVQASRMHDVRVINNNNGWDDFNYLWTQALNGFEAGHVTHFAMLHADVCPQAWWLDVLLGEMDSRNADMVSTVIPIKDKRGLTSTGIGSCLERWSAYRRFTMTEIMELPETFSLADTPYGTDDGKYILHNTGCLVCDLRNPVFRKTDENGGLICFFDFPTKVARNSAGIWENVRESEDWYFSRKAWQMDMKTFVTRKVQLDHCGERYYTNSAAWGSYQEDEETASRWSSMRKVAT